jgi:arylformamidase
VRIFDISRPLSSAVAPWPGDTPFAFELPVRMTDGAEVNVGALTLSTHFATHVDAPFHFNDSGAPIDRLDLAIFYGPALLLDVTGHFEIGPDQIPGESLPERILFKTGGWPDSSQFPDRIPTLTAETVQVLMNRGVRLIGLDVPSVDQIGNGELPIHVSVSG